MMLYDTRCARRSLCSKQYFLHFYSLPHMMRTLSKDTQNNIKNLLKIGCSYSTFIKHILGV